MLRVVAELDDPQKASELEAELNRQANYRGQHPKYEHTVSMASKEQRIEAARLGGLTTAERGHNSFRRLSPEEMAATGRAGGLRGGRKLVELKAGIHALPQEVRRQNSRKGGRRAAEVIGPQRLEELGARLGGMRGTCPHCGFQSNLGNVAQHIARCEQKAEIKPKVVIRRPA
jgi:hypothetical protein